MVARRSQGEAPAAEEFDELRRDARRLHERVGRLEGA
jgi:ubiquinone biosynthesis protein UbiJ